ncbi:hypothetical protein TNCV_3818191 [Trichonephila clavipes]|nr:hypothetical protein TNCV_3818191 [Trichonephila clavipes]
MDICKCIIPFRDVCTLNNRQAARTLVKLVVGKEMREAPDHPRVFSHKIVVGSGQIVTSPKQQKLDSDGFQELMNSHDQELTIDELIEIHEQERDIENLESLDSDQSEDRMTVVQRLRDTGSVADRKRSGRAFITKMKVGDVETPLYKEVH